MPTFYFDLHDSTGAIIDNDGYDAVDAHTAKRLALELLGQAIGDGACKECLGTITIDVRDDAGPVLTVSARIEIITP